MNYIIHLNTAFGKFCEDARLTPYHISLYFTLFQYWNIAKFRNPISISRHEVMNASRIGSVNTYIRCMKELHTWEYLQYIPSYNPLKGSQVNMYNFDNAKNTTKNNGTHISADNSSAKTTEKTIAQTHETRVIPPINNSNSKNKPNKKNNYGKRSKNVEESVSVPRRKTPRTGRAGTKKEKSSAQKENIPLHEGVAAGRGRKDEAARSSRPLLTQVQSYFTKQSWPQPEAEKFFNYFEANGWLVGGKTPMKNWKAAAKYWMINSEKFNSGKLPSPLEKGGGMRRLHTTTNKNYGEPL